MVEVWVEVVERKGMHGCGPCDGLAGELESDK